MTAGLPSRVSPSSSHADHRGIKVRLPFSSFSSFLRRSSDDGLCGVAWDPARRLGGMGPGAPGFARGYAIADTGKLALAHATL